MISILLWRQHGRNLCLQNVSEFPGQLRIQNILTICKQLLKDYNGNIGYHSPFYKDFTAAPSTATDISDFKKSPKELYIQTLRSNVNNSVVITSGVFQATCIFCNSLCKCFNRKIELPGRCETTGAAQLIKNASLSVKDTTC